jgi:hypothetical protein
LSEPQSISAFCFRNFSFSRYRLPLAASPSGFSFRNFSFCVSLPCPMNQPPPIVLELLERFDRNRDAYKSPQDSQIERLVLDRYGLNDAEIKIEEGVRE